MVHQYKLNGYNIVIDSESASVHAVDDIAYDIISKYENNSRDDVIRSVMSSYPEIGADEISECYDQVTELRKQGKLFADRIEKTVKTKRRADPPVKALCLHVAHTCNLNCSYCFASQGKYHGERALMSLETGKRALDFLIENSGTRRNLEVDFFGGEPLLNFGMIKELTAYARKIEKEHGKNFRFTLTTNGMLIDDDVIDFANRECSNVVLSLDGRKEVHDRFRKDYSGRGSWDIIVPKFQELARRRRNAGYYIRGTFTHNNPDFLKDIETMLDLGFTELSMEPVVCSKDDPLRLTEEDLPVVCRQYEELAMLMIKRRQESRPFTFYHYMFDPSNGPCIYKRLSGCGSGTEYLAVTPWGDLYPCHQFVGEERFRMGDVWKGVTNRRVYREFKNSTLLSRKECENCWARLYCSGGCAANAYHATGSVNGIYEYGCKLFRKRMECAVMMAVDKMMEEAENENPDM